MPIESRWQVEYYPDNRDRYPVAEYIDRLPAHEQVRVRNYIRLLEERGPELGEPYAKRITHYNPLCELRPLPHRVFYFLYDRYRFILLHAFQKKKYKTDKREIERAMRYMDNFMERAK